MSLAFWTSKTEKCSPYIKHIAFVNIVKKTKRTLLSVIAVMISVAIIYTSLNLFVNVYQLTKTQTTPEQGNYHYILNSTNIDNPAREEITVDDNTNLYASYQGININIRTADSTDYLPFTIISGTYPTNDQEILIPESLGIKVGDQLSLDLSTGVYNKDDLFGLTDDLDSNSSKTNYKVTGLYRSSTVFNETAKDMIFAYTNTKVENEHHTIYVFDHTIQYSDSVTFTASYFETDENEVILNNAAIDYDTIRNYLQDTTTLLIMFVFIVILAFLISIISLKNVFITSDKDRKKEFGLLKSIGATKADLKQLLVIELSTLGLIGAVLGIILGILVSYIVIKLFTKQLSVIITSTMIVNPLILVFAFLVGFLMILLIGFKSYRPYLHSNPIEDLKENTYNYDPPVKKPSYSAKSFSWKMFLIYNNRLKAQTRNIFQSFALLIMTTVLFTAILLSNLFYQIDIGDIKYDYSLNSTTANSLEPTNPDFIEALYQSEANKEIYPKTMYMTHGMTNIDAFVETSKLEKEGIDAYRKVTRVVYEESELKDKAVSKIYFTEDILDTHQQDELDQTFGSDLSSLKLNEGGVVLILSETDSAAGLFKNFKIGDKIYFNNSHEEEIKAIITYPEGSKFDTKYRVYGTFERSLYFDYDYYMGRFGAENISDYINITLENKATSSKTTVLLEKLLQKYDVHYKYTNMVETRKECKIISFILESLLYPLFVMLFIISIININNVLIGNVEIKRGDISILKSVGMGTMQLYGFIGYEYLEGYMNAAFIATAIFIPLCILEGFFGFTSAFKLGENIFSTLVMSIFIIDAILVVGLIALSLRPLKQIDAIENMKNIT